MTCIRTRPGGAIQPGNITRYVIGLTVIVLLIALQVTLVGGADDPVNDWQIIPGKRIGPITRSTTREEISHNFGRRNVVDSAEKSERATIVFPEQPSDRLKIAWYGAKIVQIDVCFGNTAGPCHWHTREGVTIGTSLNKLEDLNGGPFSIEPWKSDVGGNITSWLNGKLAHQFENSGYGIKLTLDYQGYPEGPTLTQKEALKKIDLEDRPISRDPSIQTLGLHVARLTLLFFGP